MKVSFSVLGLAVLSAGLVSCGGGGGGGGVTPSTATGTQNPVAPAAAPTVAPLPVPGIQPDVAFDFTGALQRSDFYNYPASNPLPATNANAQVAQNVSISSVNNPFGSGSAFDYHNVENDAYALQTLLFTTDSFYQINSSTSPKQILLLGSNTVDDQKNTTAIHYTNPQIVDEIPEAANQSWTNNPAGTLKITYANGNLTNRATIASGSYSEQDVYVNLGGAVYPQVNLTTSVHTDGSAKIVFVFNEEGRVGFPFKSETFTFLMSRPTASGIKLSSSAFTVPTTGSPSPNPSPSPFGVAPAWFKSPLYSETDADNGLMNVPASCNVPSAFGKQARQIVRTVQSIDAAYGTVDNTTTTRYDAANFGAVCVQISDVNNAFYDFSLADLTNQTPQQFFAFATTVAQPLIATTINEQLTLSTNGLNPTSNARTASVKPISTQAIALAELGVRQESQRARAKRMEQELRKVRDALVRGGFLK